MPERVEHNYDRHGTLCLIANFEVATGKIIAPTIGPTRTEKDYLEHIKQTVETDNDGKRIEHFIEYFNKTAAKPFKWTYTERPLNV